MGKLKEITLDEFIEDVKAREALIKEDPIVRLMLVETSMEIIKAAESGKVTILTDYDADGVCSAYIMEKTIKSVNPDCDVKVICNDRRNGYGLSPDVKGDGVSRYIICDMGSNQLPIARERLGEDVIIVDHHLIENDDIRKAFASVTTTDHSNCLCNPHALYEDDSKNAQYCATGLSYRIYQETKNICKEQGKTFLTNEKQDNTVAVMACIGTAADMVDVMDLNSYNRQILKEGIKKIDNADRNNLDFIIGYVLAQNGIGERTTAHQVAFNVGAYFNSASRMCVIMNDNGAQRLYNALTGDPNSFATYREFEYLQKMNGLRKERISELVNEEEYKKFVYEQRFGKDKDNNIAIYQLPDDVPAAFAGLIAGKLTEATDKAIICLTYNTEKGCYIGSGRNSVNNKTCLIEFLDYALSRDNELFDGKNAHVGDKLDIKYGGHEEALGISSLNNIARFKSLIYSCMDKMESKDISEKTVLRITPSELNDPETLNKILQIEPIGTGLQIPPVIITGEEYGRDKYFVKNRDDWKRINVRIDGTSLFVSDWAYSPLAYPLSGKNNNEIVVLAEIGISDFKGLHIELSSKFDRLFYKERLKEIELEQQKLADKDLTNERAG